MMLVKGKTYLDRLGRRWITDKPALYCGVRLMSARNLDDKYPYVRWFYMDGAFSRYKPSHMDLVKVAP